MFQSTVILRNICLIASHCFLLLQSTPKLTQLPQCKSSTSSKVAVKPTLFTKQLELDLVRCTIVSLWWLKMLSTGHFLKNSTKVTMKMRSFHMLVVIHQRTSGNGGVQFMMGYLRCPHGYQMMFPMARHHLRFLCTQSHLQGGVLNAIRCDCLEN